MPRLIASVLALAALGAPAAAAAASPYEQIELYTRADGVSGSVPLEGFSGLPGAVSPDGRSVYFGFRAQPGSWNGTQGLYRRDIDTNRLTRIDSALDSFVASLSADGSLLAFNTKSKLSTADRNTTWDLYTYHALSGKIDLVSRWDGVDGQAIGLTSPGFVTPDGKSALFGTSLGIGRRELAAGTTVKVDGTAATDGFGREYAFSSRFDRNASLDGRTFISSQGYGNDPKLFWPGGSAILTGAGDRTAAVNDAGTKVAYVPAPGVVRVRDVASGNESSFTVGGDAGVQSFVSGDAVLRITRQWTYDAPGTGAQGLLVLNLTSGTISDPGLWPGTRLPFVFSKNLRFGLLGNYVAAARGGLLPGGVDLPSPGVFVSLSNGCTARPWPLTAPAKDPMLDGPLLGSGLPTPSAVALQAWDSTGKLMVRSSIGTYPTKSKAWKLEVSVSYPDGRSNVETFAIAAPTSQCPFPPTGW